MSYNLNGDYECTLSGPSHIETIKNECKLKWCLVYSCNVLIGDCPPLQANWILVDNDGQLNTKTIQSLVDILDGRWDGEDFAKLEQVDPAGCEGVARCNDSQPDARGKVWTRVRWVNPKNRGSTQPVKPADPNELKSISAKFSNQLRALKSSGQLRTPPKPVTTTQTTTPTTTAPKPPTAAPRTPPPTAPTTTATSSLEECWALFEAKYREGGMKDAAIADKWIADVPAFGIDQATATPEQWGKFKATLADANGVALPF